MARFFVYEMQECTEYRKFRYEVEADTEADAIAKAKAGDASDPEDCGEMGGGDGCEFGDSGWAAVVENNADGLTDYDMFRRACDDFEGSR